MTAAAPASNTGFVMLNHDMLDEMETVNGKTFTLPMVYTYSLIKSFQENGQTAYFSHAFLQKRLRASRSFVIKMLKEMVSMGLLNKTEQVNGGTLNYTVNPITPEMLGTAEPEAEATPAALPEAPQEQPVKAPMRPAAEREEMQEPNHTAEPVEAPTVAEVKPIETAPTPGPTAPITLMTVYSEKVETADQTDPQPGEAVPVVVPAVTLYPRGEIKEPSRDWDLDPAF